MANESLLHDTKKLVPCTIVYVIRSKRGLTYTGQAKNLEDRLQQHNKGRSKWTSQDTDWKIVFSKSIPTRSEAMKYERWLKTGAGRDFLEQYLKK
ncbi:MAG: GIY-YIG nuclease family protein [Bacteroidota bacterium]